MDADAIIVGQGIAGSCLALELMDRGLDVQIFDDSWNGAACLAAAGVLNPITGKRLAKSWRSEAALPFAKEFYAGLQERLGGEFFFRREILQLCKSGEEAELWRRRKGDPAYSGFLSDRAAPGSLAPLNDNFGSFCIGFSAWVEAPRAMECLRRHFLERGVLRLERADYSEVEFTGVSVRLRGVEAKRIIFCEGWRAVDNPWFGWLPYRPARGEILTLKISADLPDKIIHREKWLMRHRGDLFRCGSTWDRENFRAASPTPEARAELEKALSSIIPGTPFETVGQESGVRPCTATTRPHLGVHPKIPNAYSFNGFGSKGYALSPFFARHFADWLLDGGTLDREADLARHVKKFFPPESRA